MAAPGIPASVKTNILNKYNSPVNLIAKFSGQIKQLEGAIDEEQKGEFPTTISDRIAES